MRLGLMTAGVDGCDRYRGVQYVQAESIFNSSLVLIAFRSAMFELQ